MQVQFQLTRYFAIASLLAFIVVGATVLHLEQRQADFFNAVQTRGADSIKRMQEAFAARAAQAAHKDLLDFHEQANVNIARLLANALWSTDVSPFLTQVDLLELWRCQAPPRPECLRSAADRIKSLPAFADLNRRVHETMQASTVFKVKLYDLYGTTIYSTDDEQIGEDKSGSPGWLAAAREGRSVSELSYRDNFSELQGTVMGRDLIASYLPLLDPITARVIAVFEIYADVTQFIQRNRASALAFSQSVADNERQLAQQIQLADAEIRRISGQQVIFLVAMLSGLYALLWIIVRRAQAVIEAQTVETASVRQRLAQAEKMTALGQMVAGVAHQLNTPLAFSRNNVEMTIQVLKKFVNAVRPVAQRSHPVLAATLTQVADEVAEADSMLSDVLMGMGQMTELVDNLRNFSRVDQSRTAEVNLNATVATVCYIAKTVISPKVELVRHLRPLPPLSCNVSQLNQVFMNLIMNAAQAIEGVGVVTVSSALIKQHICVAVRDTGKGMTREQQARAFEPYFTTKGAGEGTGLGLSIARDLVEQHGGRIDVESEPGRGTEFRVWLPLPQEKSS
ncbi:MAG: HAMP domain-containing histidine kinase [Hydrogenophaga sp.]|uniref:sensor histidine kinase n=1 Tax=Hydrogenophaga sp. TaxID=1904254 RepID=UPI001DF6F30D|nr:HAMP domain-containing sensor histidine kinase [Hydrogenophaga sp.]MBX3611405.1 HAMP domain-containing histidine kinase [Hydrogenophaga sp.]